MSDKGGICWCGYCQGYSWRNDLSQPCMTKLRGNKIFRAEDAMANGYMENYSKSKGGSK